MSTKQLKPIMEAFIRLKDTCKDEYEAANAMTEMEFGDDQIGYDRQGRGQRGGELDPGGVGGRDHAEQGGAVRQAAAQGAQGEHLLDADLVGGELDRQAVEE